MTYIFPTVEVTGTFTRKTRDTRNTFTTVVEDVKLKIRPTSVSLGFADVSTFETQLYRVRMKVVNTSIELGDRLRVTGFDDQYVLSNHIHGKVQHLIVSSAAAAR